MWEHSEAVHWLPDMWGFPRLHSGVVGWLSDMFGYSEAAGWLQDMWGHSEVVGWFQICEEIHSLFVDYHVFWDILSLVASHISVF